MPFTLSHPVAVLPFARRPLVASALVAGSMAPDLPFFLGLDELRYITHSGRGAITVDVVTSVLMLAVFHGLLKRPLLDLAPCQLRVRLARPARGFAWTWWILPSAALGALTHVGLDALTHSHIVPGFQLLRLGSSALGLVIIAWWLWRWLRRAPEVDPPPSRITAPVRLSVIASAGLACVAGAVYGFASDFGPVPSYGVGDRLEDAAVLAVGFPVMLLLAYALAWRVGAATLVP